MPSAYLSVLLLMQDSLERKFWCVSWHTLTGLIFRLRDICPEFFFVDLLFTLLCPKQSDFKSPGTSKPAMTPLWRESYPSDGHSGSCIATSGVRHQLAGKAPGPLFLVSCRWHRGLVNVLTTLRMYKIHYSKLILNCSSVVRMEASLGVSAVVSAHMGGVGYTNTAVQVWHYHCFRL